MHFHRASVGFSLLLAVVLAIPSAFSKESSPPEKEEKSVQAAVVEILEHHYRFENDGTGVVTSRARVHIRTEEGRQKYGQLFFPFRAMLQEVHLDYVRTLKPTGEIIEASVDQAMEITAPVTQQAPTFSDLKYKVIPIPALQVNDRFEYQVSVETRTPLKGGDFWGVHYPNRGLQVLSERITLDLPADRVVILKRDETIAHRVEEEDGRRLHRWTLTNPKPRTGKALQRRLFTVSSLGSWSEVGAWFAGLQADRTTLTPELAAQAHKLVVGKEDPRERLEAVYRYVSQSVRYVSISLGLGGYQAHRAADVWRNQYGDCKDKHFLLQVLLSAVGLKAYPALISSNLPIEPTVPSPGQFDHAISVVPLGEQWVWLDTTLEVAPLGFLPAALRGKQALVILEDESHLVESPKESQVTDRQQAWLLGEINAKGTLVAKLGYANRGVFEVIWRQVFRRGNPEAIKHALKLVRPYVLWDADTEPPVNSDPLDLGVPFRIEYQLTKKKFINPLKRSGEINLPTLLLRSLPWTLPDTETKKEGPDEEKDEELEDIHLGGPVEVTEHLELAVAPAFELRVPDSIHEERDFARYESTYELREGRVVVWRSLKMLQAKLPLSRREELKAFEKILRRDRDQVLIVQRVGEMDILALADELSADELEEAGLEAITIEKNFEKARELFEKATEKDSEHETAWDSLGLALDGLGRLDEAEAAYRKQIEVNPRDDDAFFHLGQLLRAQSHYEEAVQVLEKSIEINPLNSKAYVQLAGSYAEMEQWKKAEAAYDKALGSNRKGPALYVERGVVQLRQGKREQAQASFDLAIELSGGPAIYNNIAYVLAEDGQELELALRYAESAVAQVEAELRLLDSLRNWKRALTLQTSLGAYLDTLGWALFQQDKPEEAIRYLEAAFELLPDSVVAEHLARAHAVQRQAEQAWHYYLLAVHLAPMRRITVELPSELEPYVEEEVGGREALTHKVERARAVFDTRYQLEPEDGAFNWPKADPKEATERLSLLCLVDEAGRVLEVESLMGSEPWRTAALGDARRLRFNPVAWGGRPIKTLRAITFNYKPDRTVEVSHAVFHSLSIVGELEQSSSPQVD